MPELSFHRLIPFTLPAFLLGATLYSCAPQKSGETQDATKKAASPDAAAPTKLASQASPTVSTQPGAKTAGPPHFDRPKYVKGIYLTAWSAGSKTKMAKMYDMIDHTELNSVVIDVRDTGEMYFKTGIKLADDSKANEIAVTNPEKLFNDLAAHKIWPIARIACFRDNKVPKHFPELAVQVESGRVWKDRSGHMWLDPYNKKNWEYLAQTVDYALNIGFPEIQLDYVRFPSEGKSKTQVFPARNSYPDKTAKPEDVVASFCEFIRDKVKARHGAYSADIFGIISSTKKDEGIGQALEKVAKPFDVLSPMVYPSHFNKGEYGIADPNKSPYEIVKKSLTDYKKRVPNAQIRPWLQDFTLRHVHYGIPEVRAQIKAARDVGYEEFLLWNASNRYTPGALAPKGPPLVAKGPDTQTKG